MTDRLAIATLTAALAFAGSIILAGAGLHVAVTTAMIVHADIEQPLDRMMTGDF